MKNPLQTIPSLIVLFGLTGCATFFFGAESSENVARLKKGMSQPRVMHYLGRPDIVVRKEDRDRWVYELRSGPQKGRTLFVDFKDGVLLQNGEMSGRDVAAAEQEGESGTCTRWVKPEYRDSSRCSD